jgi:polysaccharide export outer membrane protein
MRTLALACLVVTLSGCPTVTYDYSKEPDPRKHEFILGASDALRITVWKNPELSTDARIRPDGTITMPLVGDVQAAGKTPNQLREEIAKRLSTYVKDETSVVTIAVTEVNSYRFTVSGNVERPGVFSSRHYVTVLEALALAGGLNRFASPKRIVLVRSQPGQPPRRIPLDYERISSGNYPEENLVVMAGDTLFVP